MFELRQYFLLFIAATIFGSGFVAQKLGMNYVSPFTFTFLRTLIGVLFLLPFVVFIKRSRTYAVNLNKISKSSLKRYSLHNRKFLQGSILCGLMLIIAESLQQFGLVYTEVNKASFITALYMILVPIVGIFFKQKISLVIGIATLVSALGLYLMCIKEGFDMEKGDLLVFLCAITFALHILVISYYINYVDGVMLSLGQFFCASVLGLICMLFDGLPAFDNLMLAVPAILYAGIMSNGIAYTLQIVGQRGVNPSIASLILSLESVMGAIFGIWLLQESLTRRELLGAVLKFVAVLISQYRPKKSPEVKR